MGGSQYDHLTYDELHNLCKSRGYCKKDAKTVLETRLEAMDAAERNSPQVQSGNMDTSFSALGKIARSRSVSQILDIPTQLSVGKRVRGEQTATNMAVDLAVVNTHAQWWSSDLKPQMTALSHQMIEGNDEAASAWVADECNRVLGQELSAEEELSCKELAHEGKMRELEAWKKFKVFSSVNESDISKTVIDSRWV